MSDQSATRATRLPVVLCLVGCAVAALLIINSTARSAGAGKASAHRVGGGPGCDDNRGCTWAKVNYDGDKDVFYPGAGGLWFNVAISDGYDNSAKNRFDARNMKLADFKNGNDVYHVIACLNPGDNRPNPGPYKHIFISDTTGDQCD